MVIAENHNVASTRGWAPFLCSGGRRGAVIAKLREIAEALVEPGYDPSLDGAPASRDLMNGAAGTAVFYAYLARGSRALPELGDPERFAELAERHLDYAIEGVASLPMSPTLAGGFCGVAWAMTHLDEQLGLAVEIPEAIDEALVELVSAQPWRGEFDLISGLAGFGVYFLDRVPRPMAMRGIRELLARLEECATRDADGLAWFTPPERVPSWQREQCAQGFFDLGVAHGLAGVVAWLASLAEAGIERERAEALASGALAWLQAHACSTAPDAGFPWAVVASERAVPGRTAWCYGDPGIGAVLVRAGTSFGRPAWRERGEGLLLEVAAHPRGVVDACLCHGSAGLVLMLLRAWQGDPERAELRAALERWIDWTLEAAKPTRGVAGYQMLVLDEDERWVDRPGLLEGAAGIGASLLACVVPDPPAWDRSLGLSGPRRGPA